MQLMKIGSNYNLHDDETTMIDWSELLLPTRFNFRHPLNSCDVVMWLLRYYEIKCVMKEDCGVLMHWGALIFVLLIVLVVVAIVFMQCSGCVIYISTSLLSKLASKKISNGKTGLHLRLHNAGDFHKFSKE